MDEDGLPGSKFEREPEEYTYCGIVKTMDEMQRIDVKRETRRASETCTRLFEERKSSHALSKH